MKQTRNSKRQKVWIVVDHPMYFVSALAAILYWGHEKFIFNLLISPHSYWARVDINLYKNQFDEIHYLERPEYTWHPVRVLRRILQIWRLKKRIANFRIERDDIIIGLSTFHYLENIVLSMHPENLKIAIMPHVVYQESIREMDRSIYQRTIEGWVASHLIEPSMGLHRTYCMRTKLPPTHYWVIRYKESLTDIYDKIVVLGIFSDEQAQLGDRIITMPFPYGLSLGKKEAVANTPSLKPQKVVFFGTPFESMLAMPPEVYAEHLNLCFSFLREKYGRTHKLVYRPHPIERNEMKRLNLEQFEIEDDGMLAEFYLYQNVGDIYAVFSVESTSSRSGFAFYINSYAFLDIFPYDETVKKKFFRLTMGNVPDDFYIGNLTETPKRYIKADDVDAARRRCQQVLAGILPK